MNVSNVNSPTLASTSETQGKAKAKAEKKGKGARGAEEEAGFNGQLMQAAAVQPASKPETPKAVAGVENADAKQKTPTEKPVRAELSGKGIEMGKGLGEAGLLKIAQNGGNAIHAQSVDSRSYSMNVDRSPETQKAAASLNTATAIAGLKPWSKEWVFEGNLDAPAVKPLIASKPSAEENAMLSELSDLEQLLAGAGMARAGAASGGMQGISGQAEPVKGGASAHADMLMRTPEATLMSQRGELSNAADISGFNGANPNLAGLNIESVQVGSGPMANGLAKPGQTGGARPMQARGATAGGAAALSGGEFLNTLSAVRADSMSPAGQAAQADASGRDGQGTGSGQLRQGGLRPDLKVIEGGARNRGQLSSQFGEAMGSAEAVRHLNNGTNAQMGPMPLNMTGHVTQGAMATNRLSSESLLGLSTGIRELKAQGGGEIRVRLRPENLGELHLKVVTHGNNVGLQIQASDENAKKILEQTMSHLKDSLASQNLTLGRVELTVASASEGFSQNLNQNSGQNSADQGQQNQWNAYQAQQGFGQDLMGQSQNGNQRQWNVDNDAIQNFEKSRSKPALGSVTTRAVGSAGSSMRMAGNGRLDVMA